MPEVRIRFIRGTHWDSKVIEYCTRSWCSHVEAIENGFCTYGAMLDGGVKARQFSDKTYASVSKFEVWNIPCTQDQVDKFWKFLLDQNGKPYDWRAIVSFGLGERDWQEPDSWFCSELQVAAGLAAGFWSIPSETHIDRIDPGSAYLLFTTLPGANKLGASI